MDGRWYASKQPDRSRHLNYCYCISWCPRTGLGHTGEGRSPDTIAIVEAFTVSSSFWPGPLVLTEVPVHHSPGQPVLRPPNTRPLRSSATAFKLRKIKNCFKSIVICWECLARSGETSNSTPSWRTVWYAERFLRRLTWVSTDTSVVEPAQEEMEIRSTAARPPFL